MLTWFAFGYTAVRWVRMALAKRADSRASGQSGWLTNHAIGASRPAAAFSMVVGAVLAVSALGLGAIVGADAETWMPQDSGAWLSTGHTAQRVAGLVVRRTDLNSCRFRVGTNPTNGNLTAAITYELVIRHRHPAPTWVAPQLDAYYTPQAGDPAVAVTDTVKARVPSDPTQLGVVAARDPNGTRHRYVVSLALPTPARGPRRHAGAC
jgi:hypothetical protein